MFQFLTPMTQIQRAFTFVKETKLKLKSHIKPHVWIVLLSLTNRSARSKLNREILELTDVINQKNLRDICKMFHPNKKEYASFSASSSTVTTYSATKQVSTDTKKKMK